jgi:hypothetical protein
MQNKQQTFASILWLAVAQGVAVVIGCLYGIGACVEHLHGAKSLVGFSFFAGLGSLYLGYAWARGFSRYMAKRVK